MTALLVTIGAFLVLAAGSVVWLLEERARIKRRAARRRATLARHIREGRYR
ncbi:hypothetical protein ABGB07_44925 [Micromonosporaceae bacterium B7E4]